MTTIGPIYPAQFVVSQAEVETDRGLNVQRRSLGNQVGFPEGGGGGEIEAAISK